jgi:anti-sigma factor RsiW
MTCPDRARTQSCLDGQPGEADRKEAERHIDACPECRELRAEITSVRHLMRQRATRHRAPRSLAGRIGAVLDGEDMRRARDARINRRSFWLGAAGGTGLSALAAGLAFLVLLPASSNSLMQSLIDAHTQALMSGHVIAVASSNHHTVKPWFAGRVPVSPPVADFAQDGFTLAGGRVDEIAGSQAAVVVYRHGAHEIDLFVWADRGSRLPAPGVRHGYHAVFWKNGDLDFAAISDMQSSELSRFVELVKSERE